MIRQIEVGQLLKTAGFTIVHYGDKTPQPPYVVIKPGLDPLARGNAFKIIMHRAIGEISQLNTDIHTIIQTLETIMDYTSEDFDPTVFGGNSDDTISREQNFLMVQKY